MDVQTVDASSARAEEARWDDFASTSTIWQREGSRHVAEEAMSLLFILAHFSTARLRMSLELRQTTVKEDWLVPEVDRGCSHAAELAGAVGTGKRCDHPISPLDGRHLRSHFFNHSHRFMDQPPPWLKGFQPSVGPYTRPTDAGMGDANDGICWLLQCGIWDLFDSDIEGAVKDRCTHMLLSPFFSSSPQPRSTSCEVKVKRHASTELAPHASGTSTATSSLG